MYSNRCEASSILQTLQNKKPAGNALPKHEGGTLCTCICSTCFLMLFSRKNAQTRKLEATPLAIPQAMPSIYASPSVHLSTIWLLFFVQLTRPMSRSFPPAHLSPQLPGEATQLGAESPAAGGGTTRLCAGGSAPQSTDVVVLSDHSSLGRPGGGSV